MTRILISLALFALCVSQAFAQGPPKKQIKFGDISDEELKYSICDFEPDAKAVILRDNGIIEFRSNGNNLYCVLMRHKLIKVLDSSVSGLGDIKVYYYKGEKINKIKAQSISPSGERIEIAKSDIHHEKETKYVSSVRFAVPKISAGSIIEISYETSSTNITTLPTWDFQSYFPTLESNLTACSYPYLDYTFLMQHLENLEQRTLEGGPFNFSGRGSNNTKATEFSMKNIPSIKNEVYITNIEDHRAKMRFQLSGTQFPTKSYEEFLTNWDDVAIKLTAHSDFGTRMRFKPSFKDCLKALEAAHPNLEKLDPKERYKTIYNFVRNTIESNGERGFFVDQKLDKVFEKKVGSIDEINQMIIALSKVNDIDANPALTSTHDHGKLLDIYPFMDQFNYLFVHVAFPDGTEIYSDGADHLLDYDEIPAYLYNEFALIVRKNKGEVKYMTPPTRSMISYFKGDLKENGDIVVDYKLNLDNLEASKWRNKLNNDEDYVKTYLLENHEDISIESIENQNVEDYTKNLKITTKCSFNEAVDLSGDMVYFEPVLSKFVETNPFVKEERKMPIDFMLPFKEQYILSMSIPEGFDIESLPKSETISLMDKSASFTYSCTYNNKVITIRNVVEFKKKHYPSKDYEYVKGLFEQIINKQSEMIVLKKI